MYLFFQVTQGTLISSPQSPLVPTSPVQLVATSIGALGKQLHVTPSSQKSSIQVLATSPAPNKQIKNAKTSTLAHQTINIGGKMVRVVTQSALKEVLSNGTLKSTNVSMSTSAKPEVSPSNIRQISPTLNNTLHQGVRHLISPVVSQASVRLSIPPTSNQLLRMSAPSKMNQTSSDFMKQLAAAQSLHAMEGSIAAVNNSRAPTHALPSTATSPPGNVLIPVLNSNATKELNSKSETVHLSTAGISTKPSSFAVSAQGHVTGSASTTSQHLKSALNNASPLAQAPLLLTPQIAAAQPKHVQLNVLQNTSAKTEGQQVKCFLYNIGGKLVTQQGVPVTMQNGVLKFISNSDTSFVNAVPNTATIDTVQPSAMTASNINPLLHTQIPPGASVVPHTSINTSSIQQNQMNNNKTHVANTMVPQQIISQNYTSYVTRTTDSVPHAGSSVKVMKASELPQFLSKLGGKNGPEGIGVTFKHEAGDSNSKESNESVKCVLRLPLVDKSKGHDSATTGSNISSEARECSNTEEAALNLLSLAHPKS